MNNEPATAMLLSGGHGLGFELHDPRGFESGGLSPVLGMRSLELAQLRHLVAEVLRSPAEARRSCGRSSATLGGKLGAPP
jgi:hypothetical protein